MKRKYFGIKINSADIVSLAVERVYTSHYMGTHLAAVWLCLIVREDLFDTDCNLLSLCIKKYGRIQ